MSFAHSEDDTVRAHDTLVAIILGELPPEIHIESNEAMRGAADVLCWLLGHDHNQQFQENLDKIESYLTSKGLIQQPFVPQAFYDDDA